CSIRRGPTPAMKLADAGERPVFRRRHAEYYRELLQKMPGDAEAAANPHLDDIRAALNWGFGSDGDPSIGVGLAIHSGPILMGKALFAECHGWMTRADAALSRGGGEATPQQLGIYLSLAAAELFTGGMSEKLTDLLIKTLQLAEGLDDAGAQLACHLP